MSKAEYLIQKRGAFYRPNSQGYTDSFYHAGRYTLEEAEKITHPNGPDGPRDEMTYVHQDKVPRDQISSEVLLELPEVKALIDEALEKAAAAVETYAGKIFDAPIYWYYSDVTQKQEYILFKDFGLSVEISDAKELEVVLTCGDRWHWYSDIRHDEMRDTEEAVMKKALQPLADTIRVLKGNVSGN